MSETKELVSKYCPLFIYLGRFQLVQSTLYSEPGQRLLPQSTVYVTIKTLTLISTAFPLLQFDPILQCSMDKRAHMEHN